MKSFVLIFLLALAFSPAIYGQTNKKQTANSARFSPAYGELILRKVEVETEIFDLRQKFTNESLQVKGKVRELAVINREMNALRRIKRSDVPKLNETYAKILLEKIAAEAKVLDLRDKFTAQHADFKTARYKFRLLDKELKDYLKK